MTTLNLRWILCPKDVYKRQPVSLLELPAFGCVNVHASLLPKLRGASPIQHAILSGERMTGVTIMQMGEGLDTGDMLAKRDVYKRQGAESYGSGGVVTVTMSNGSGTSSLSCRLKFTAKAAGSSYITAETSDVYNLDMEELSAQTKSIKVTVKNTAASASTNANLASLQVSGCLLYTSRCV